MEFKKIPPRQARELAQFAVEDFLEWCECQRAKQELSAEPVNPTDRLVSTTGPARKPAKNPWAGKPPWLAEILSAATEGA